MHSFMLHTPNRAGGGFPLLADSETSKQEWIVQLNQVIAEAMGTPDESVATSTYEDDEDLYATIEECRN